MSYSFGGCVSRSSICVARGDDTSLVVSVYDDAGYEFDISGAIEIEFIVATGVTISGNIGPGGTVLIKKLLSSGGVVIAGSRFQFTIAIAGADTRNFTSTNNYYELRVTTSTGLNKTISAGLFKSQNTMIKDIP